MKTGGKGKGSLFLGRAVRSWRGRGGFKPRLTEADRAILEGEVRSIVEWAHARARAGGLGPLGSRRRAAFRDYLVIRTLAESGLRASELCGLEVGDLRLEDKAPHLVVRAGKMRKPGERDSVFLPLGLAAELSTWIQRARVTGPGAHVFQRWNGSPLSRREVWAIVKRAVLALGLNPRYSTHTLRHGYISALCRTPGATPYAVARQARLRSLDMILRYYHSQPKDLAALAEGAAVGR
jgi:integrase